MEKGYIETKEGIFTKLGDFQILKTLGTGASCKVKLARNLKDKQCYALKILKSEYAVDQSVIDELKILL